MEKRIAHRPLTLPKHPQLLDEINEMSIAIKLHHHYPPERTEKPEQWAKAQANCPCPTWENVTELLMRCYRAIDEQRESPIKY